MNSLSEVWDSLISIQDYLIEKLNKDGTEYHEKSMEPFNHAGWTNRLWQGDGYRRAHIDTVDARSTKGLWMMHCCIQPNLDNNAPIFGLDVIAGENKVTGFFHDYSPVSSHDHDLSKEFANMVADLDWSKKRELPDWAKAIFSDDMIAAGNVRAGTQDLTQIVEISKSSVDYYLMRVADFNETMEIEQGKIAHNRYAHYQKQNPHTPRTMKSLGLSENDVDTFISECLFPEI